MKIPFSPPYIDEAVINEVVDSLRSGWITSGPKVKALEEEIKVFSNAKEVLCVNSWTSGAIMMLRWLGVTAEDEVIVPAYTYSATALAVLHAGAKPVMVDSGEDFNISVDAIRKAITPRTKAIIPVDIAGFPCDYDRIMRLVNEPEIRNLFQAASLVQEKLGRILVMNDAAHSLGAYYNKNQRTGCETDIAIFSLHAVKNVTTAEGGAICLNLPEPFDNAELYKELRMMSLNCQTKDAFSKSKAGGWRYDIVGLGMKINMADVNAAIGLAQIREYPELLKERKRVFNTYSKAFADCDWAILPPSEDGEKERTLSPYFVCESNTASVVSVLDGKRMADDLCQVRYRNFLRVGITGQPGIFVAKLFFFSNVRYSDSIGLAKFGEQVMSRSEKKFISV